MSLLRSEPGSLKEALLFAIGAMLVGWVGAFAHVHPRIPPTHRSEARVEGGGMRNRGGALALGFALMVWSGAAPAPPECAPGKPCDCSRSEACELTCVPDAKHPARGCDFSCAGAGSCTFHCPEGRCSSRSSGTGATELTCEGGSCTMTCSGPGTCELNDCRSGCKLACSGSGVCENDCTGPGCSCTGRSCQ